MDTFNFVSAGRLNQLTGGYIYNARVINTLRRHDIDVNVIELEGVFPQGDDTARRALDHALSALPDQSRVICDGLAIANLPDIVEAHQHRLHLTAVVHLPIADETGLPDQTRQQYMAQEKRTLAAMDDIIVTSRFMARRLADYGIEPDTIRVVEPGVDKVAASQPDLHPRRLLCVATVIPRKGQALLVDALAELSDLGWKCDIVGDLERDPEYVDDVRARIKAHGLEERIELHGEYQGEQLQSMYQRASLFVLPSYFESYGMVISEAIAYGVPVVTMNGGALMETLPRNAGITLPPGDTNALSNTLRHLLQDNKARQQLAQGALEARSSLRLWTDTGYRFMKAVRHEQPA
ncbi:glycosyltransferase family 4 protein [Larsenimonas rhizosphaerae]|uniref:Glycosyltransferase family 4 protein n=1 Tax=Larsenimonas rhizosphaerae TaxID=2944682 RepID=A0AA42CTB8_9GAMM|nr:glycosyltransferase family 4 protein [Larsenimonas rhizosphaerae]MCX2523024.1 glycosyltransferase family 4 protein [Larsenimonas rhizosphaerae]